MRLLPLLALELMALLAIAPREVAAQIGPPTMWELRQNDPNPFCSNPGATRIDFTVPQSARVELVVLSPDGNQVVRSLEDAMVVVGFFTVVWDGRVASNMRVSYGMYPYRLTATDAQSNLLFQGTKTATVECIVGVQQDRWGIVKRFYR